MTNEEPEFSRLIAVEGIIPDKARDEKIEATEAECAALAKRFGVRTISNLRSALTVRRVMGGAAVRVNGTFHADIVQACVVSLQDVNTHVDGKFDTYFTEEPEGKTSAEMEFSHEDDENTPEMVINGQIDLGEVVAQYLSLEIDPYPRAPGVSLAAQLAESGIKQKESPFQVLEQLKDSSKKADK